MAVGIGSRKIFFIINPEAGGGRARSWWEKIITELQACRLDFFWQFTTSPGSARTQVAEAIRLGAEVVVTVGGDGSLYHAVNGLIKNDTLIKSDLVFAAWPVGSACDFVRSLPPQGDNLIELLEHGTVKPMDIGRCLYQDLWGNPVVEYFINSFDVGAGADTCAAVNAAGGRIKRRLKNGSAAFKYCALKVLMRYRYCPIEVIVDGECRVGQYIIIGCGNGRYMGGNMLLFPGAALDSGQLEVLLVHKMSKPLILRLFSRVYDGNLAHLTGVTYLSGKNICIKSQLPLAIELDGEVPGTTPVELSVLPGILPLLYLK